MESIVPIPDGVSWQDWLVRQTERSDDVGGLARLLLDDIRGGQNALDFGARRTQDTLQQAFADFNADTEGQTILDRPASFVMAPQNGLIALVENWIATGQAPPFEVESLLEHLRLAKELMRRIDEKPDADGIAQLARRLEDLL
ncbi:hypothetical protein [Kitasatospora sp. NPDC005748]|uniref:hypothetical protein n=1 Tax=Kitasatospora sp. NPDC005748 TaxID=3157063 RepID=UPI0033E084CD